MISEAACFATPPDNPAEGRLQSSSALVRRAAMDALGGRPQTEASWAAVDPGHAGSRQLLSEALEASSDIRRQRRRALVRALRVSRTTARSLLEAPGTALASLASLDGAQRSRGHDTPAEETQLWIGRSAPASGRSQPGLSGHTGNSSSSSSFSSSDRVQ